MYSAPTVNAVSYSNSIPIPGLSEAQYQSLLSMVGTDDNENESISSNNFTFMNSKENWMIGTSASLYITRCAD